uniref:Uncharacterized protein n=1 Tax=Glossina pallidipes TaxID=7398 RepID=A0A1B0ABW8_GLOPL
MTNKFIHKVLESTTGIGPPATLTSNLLGFMGGIGIASSQAAAAVAVAANNAGNAATGFHNNNNNNDNNNNMDNTSEDSNPVTIYRPTCDRDHH